jgi:DNA-directed RNA polymerase subunit K/omega
MPIRSELDDLEDVASVESDDESSLEDGVKPPPPPNVENDDDSVAADDDSDSDNDDDDDIDSLAGSIPDIIRPSSQDVGGQNMSFVESEFGPGVGDDDDDDDDEDDSNYLQRFDDSLKTNIISEYHPELKVHNNEEVEVMSRVVRNEQGLIIDPLHRTVPFLTKYERARILGERAKQLNMGAKPLVEIDPTVIDGYLIALEEFAQWWLRILEISRFRGDLGQFSL